MSLKVIQIVSEWKKRPSPEAQAKFGRVEYGHKMVEAIVEVDHERFTQHIQVPR